MGRQTFWTTIGHISGSRKHTRLDETRFPEVGCFTSLYEPDTTFTENVRSRSTRNATQSGRIRRRVLFWRPFEVSAQENIKFANVIARLLATVD